MVEEPNKPELPAAKTTEVGTKSYNEVIRQEVIVFSSVHDNRNLVRKALPAIESEHNSTPELEALVQRARRAIDQ